MKPFYWFIAGLALVFNLIWESLHVRLYISQLSIETWLLVFVATLGDVILTLVAISLLRQVKRINPKVNDLVILAGLGFIIALAIEKVALVHGWWEYKSSMPLIPYLNVGLSPIVQLTFLIPLAYGIAKPDTVR